MAGMRQPVYLAGPMNGLPELNRPEFYRVAKILEMADHTVINPATIEEWAPKTWTYERYLRAALLMMLECESVVLLPGWQDSHGATVEKELAEQLKMEVYEWTEIGTFHSPVETWSAEEIAAAAYAADIGAVTGTTVGPGGSGRNTGTAHATGSPSAGRATPGYIRLVESRPSERD